MSAKKKRGKLHWVPTPSLPRLHSSKPGGRTACGLITNLGVRGATDRAFLVQDDTFAPGYVKNPGKHRCMKCWRVSRALGAAIKRRGAP